MKKPNQELSGDYSYDLAHEARDMASAQSDKASHAEPSAHESVRKVGPEGDYGYDEAHDL